jgi:hypothetical protein
MSAVTGYARLFGRLCSELSTPSVLRRCGLQEASSELRAWRRPEVSGNAVRPAVSAVPVFRVVRPNANVACVWMRRPFILERFLVLPVQALAGAFHRGIC